MRLQTLSGCMALLMACLTPSVEAQEFHGYPCTQDCSGHEAGYAWAERNDITDPDDCGGNSNSFIEGCMAYAEEHEESQSVRSEDCNETTDDCDSE